MGLETRCTAPRAVHLITKQKTNSKLGRKFNKLNRKERRRQVDGKLTRQNCFYQTASGIGLSIAKACARHGMNVVITDAPRRT